MCGGKRRETERRVMKGRNETEGGWKKGRKERRKQEEVKWM